MCWPLLAGALSWACSSGSNEPIDASGAGKPRDGSNDELAGGAVVAPLVLGALHAPASGTTPDAIEITLSSNLDTISVRSKVTDPQGAAVSDCEVTDLFRVGPSAVDWAIGSSRTVPLAYGAALADGVYWHAVSMGIGAFGNTWLQTSVLQPFEVDGGVLRPLTDQQFRAAVGEPEEASVAPADPCPALPDYTDEMAADGATSSIDLAPWQGLGTIQPLRWVESAMRPQVGVLPSLLTFHALVADRGRLQLDIITPSETPADFDASFPDDGRILLDELAPGDLAASSWTTSSGSAHVRIDGGRVRVELTDIVFSRARGGPAVAPRSVESGLLEGDVVAEEWP